MKPIGHAWTKVETKLNTRVKSSKQWNTREGRHIMDSGDDNSVKRKGWHWVLLVWWELGRWRKTEGTDSKDRCMERGDNYGVWMWMWNRGWRVRVSSRYLGVSLRNSPYYGMFPFLSSKHGDNSGFSSIDACWHPKVKCIIFWKVCELIFKEQRWLWVILFMSIKWIK